MNTSHLHRARLAGALRLLVLAALIVSAGCSGRQPAPTEGSLRTSHPAASPAAGGWYTLYFTDPDGPNRERLRGGPDAALAQAIRAARVSVEMAVLQLDLWSIRDALLDAQQRGLLVRVVIESDYRDAPEVQDLLQAGIALLGDRREGLMHDKFTIIDRQEVWMGSMNYTVNEAYKNNNSLLHIRSRELAQDYLAEFEEMFRDDQFGPGSPANTPQPSLNINGTPVSVCFSPDDGCAAQIAAVLEQARQSIDFMAYSFTSDDLAQVILDRAGAGVRVRGVMETGQISSNSGGEYANFLKAGLDVRKDGNRANMHHKVIIVDGRYVIVGSYNFTYNAETRNDENLLIIDSPQIAGQYLAEFQKVYQAAR
ncbi:MAG: phospholipase D-like domain-containing protein [Chloroflexota bacterium]